jgi:hypothetical protein
MVKSFELFENAQQSKSILKKLNISEDNADYIKLKELLKNNTSYLGKFTKFLFVDKEKIENIEKVLDELKKVKIDKSVDSFNELEEITDYIIKFQNDKITKKIISTLPSKIKAQAQASEELFSLVRKNIDLMDALIGYYDKSKHKFDSVEQLINSTKIMITNWKGRDEVLRKIKDKNVSIICNTSKLLVVCIAEYKTMKELGSSDWCIVRDNHHWNRYVTPANKQYIIWDFTKDIESKQYMIGVTMTRQGKVTSAFWLDNTEVKNSQEYIDGLDCEEE